MYIFVYMSVFFFFFTGTLIIGFCDTLIWKKIRRNEREWPTPNLFFVFSHLYFVSWDIFLKFLIFFSGCYCSRDKRVIERYYHTVYRWFFNSSGLADGNIIKEKVNRADGLSLHSSLFFFFFDRTNWTSSGDGKEKKRTTFLLCRFVCRTGESLTAESLFLYFLTTTAPVSENLCRYKLNLIAETGNRNATKSSCTTLTI
jgi:hypothetical protein